MNMPVNDEGKVNFTTTLFALIRENLNIHMYDVEAKETVDSQDAKDKHLREVIFKLWPLQAKKVVDKLIPPDDELGRSKLTVGKIYGGLLVLENWRTTKFGRIQPAGIVVCVPIDFDVKIYLLINFFLKSIYEMIFMSHTTFGVYLFFLIQFLFPEL